MERLSKESEVYGSIYVWQPIPSWCRKNDYKRGRVIRRIESMEVSQEIIDRCRRNNLFLSRVD
jgi:hypothetical protein